MLQFLIDNWVLLLAALTSGGLLLWPQLSSGGASSVTPAEAVRLMNREKGVLVDVSDASEYKAEHAVGSRHAPLASLQQASLPSEIPSNKSLPVVLICARGSRSARGVGALRKAGYERVYSVAGGLNAWREAQLPTQKA